MPIHDSYARITPFELAFPPDRFGPDELGAIRDEVEGLGRPTAAHELGLFMGLDSVGRILSRVRDPEASREDVQRHGVLLFHAFHFHEAGHPLYFLPTPTARYLVEGDFDGVGTPPGPAPPDPAGYLQLPRNLFWIEPVEEGPPEPVDGLFWSAPDGESISVLVAAGVRPDRGGFSILPLPRLPLEHADGWVSTRIREESDDFASDMPGAELENLYSVEATGEVLKLLARTFLHLREVPGAAVSVDVDRPAVPPSSEESSEESSDESPDGDDPRPTSLGFRRVGLMEGR